ncbi:hypothetical protein SAMN06296010_3220 [Agreia pratensis]|uniref:Uncharacterized protein n=1 Tax=Agreia pratensis TaxID=150121 RepID=A0A1X7L2D4_9MICO|nr:hypothetical protein SAMN06296010_3220 [Agreia pratensis]
MNRYVGTWSIGRFIFLGVGIILVGLAAAQIVPAIIA